MNMPRQLAPTPRKPVSTRLRANDTTGVVIAGCGYAAVTPSDSLDDLCRSQCSTVHNDSGYNLCVQLCRSTRRN